MTSALCDSADLYLDGELDDEAAAAFRLHLPDCASCQERLVGGLQVEAMAALTYGAFAPAAATAPTPVPAAADVRRARPRWARRTGSVMGALAVASIAAVVALTVRHAAPATPLWQGAEVSRGLEARLSYLPADQHRPYVPMRGDSEAAHPPPLAAVAALEERGDFAGVAAAYLEGGDPGLAERYLLRLPPSPQREIDRAAAALAAGEPERALELASGALESAPRSPQGQWNRALALRDLGLTAEAASAFRALAALGEPGWSAEAERRAQALAPHPAEGPAGAGDGERARLHALRRQADAELDAGHRAAADRLLGDVVRGCRALGLDARCSE